MAMAAQLSRRALFGRLAGSQHPAEPVPAETGVAQLNGRCISLQGVSCRLCAAPCEPAAFGFRLMTGGRALPIIDESRCTGCGLCIPSCPVSALSMVPVPAAEV
jgi:ferredoxin-type protein NapF